MVKEIQNLSFLSCKISTAYKTENFVLFLHFCIEIEIH